MKYKVFQRTLVFLVTFFLYCFFVSVSYQQTQALPYMDSSVQTARDNVSHTSAHISQLLSNDPLCENTFTSTFQENNSAVIHRDANALFSCLILHILFLLLRIFRPPLLMKRLTILYQSDGKKDHLLFLTV